MGLVLLGLPYPHLGKTSSCYAILKLSSDLIYTVATLLCYLPATLLMLLHWLPEGVSAQEIKDFI